jgi:prolyl oligopeptidase
LVLFRHEDFLTPPSTYLYNDKTRQLKLRQQEGVKFDSALYTSKQMWAVSKDGTKVSYFVVSKKGIEKNGKNPTLIYGYGGFEISETPFYLGGSSWHNTWLDQGGVFVLTNIRGGGEFGPQWHEAAILENKQKSYDDFIAIIESVHKEKISSPKNTGIMGGSNGGLLMGAIFTQRPDLMNAVVCQVPLLDMLRYSKLLAGASWMAEYGNPDEAKAREFILKYSPYQNLKAGVKYPEVLFVTSTKDDRVHPGHARKMHAKMEELNQPSMLYENPLGGHGSASDVMDRAFVKALERVYLLQKLKP